MRAAGYGALPTQAFEDGMRNADWPARLQRLSRGALAEIVPERAELWLDGGHNPDGGRVLAQAMADLSRLDTRMLHDMGISRGQIPALARSSDR